MASIDDTSVYPDEIDGYSTLPLRRNLVHEIRAEDHNRLRNAIVRIQQELGTNPSGSYSTVAALLNNVADAKALIDAHLIDTTDAHPAVAISITDSGDNYVATNVEDALSELAAILPVALDVIGANNTDIPNSGIPDFVEQEGTLFLFNTVGGGSDVEKTQPINITGIQVIEVGEANGEGSGAELVFNPVGSKLTWKAPGDSAGAEVDVSSLATGEIVTLSSGDTSKKIRIVRTSAPFNIIGLPTDIFDIYKLKAKTGAYSLDGTGIKDTNFITRTSVGSTGTSRSQFVIKGTVFPADKGTLVLQRKLRSSSQFSPSAVLDLAENFDEDARADGQLVYTPSLEDFDTIILYDRHPARKDYETLALDADGNPIYENFDLSATFSPFQIAKYVIPVSNNTLIGGALEAPIDISASDVNDKVSTYRLVHYGPGVTDFNGEPDTSNIFSISDSFSDADDGDNTVRMSNVFLDDDATRPSINALVLRPALDVEVLEKTISGIHYFNGADDLFDIEMKSDTNIFKKSYLRNDILRFTTDVFTFPSGDGYGQNVRVTQLRDDGYDLYSDSNLPDFTDISKDHAFYLVNVTINDGRRLYIGENKFSVRSHITGTIYDPFGPGDANDAYGLITSQLKILSNSYSRYRATDTEEYFTDESYRVGSNEIFDFELDNGQFTHDYGSNGDGYTLKAWDSGVALDTVVDVNSSTANGLQCGGKFGTGSEPDDTADFVFPGLIYPQDDYSATDIRPLQFGSVDYSAFSGDRYYQRLFSLNKTTNGGKLRIVSAGSSLISFNDIAASNASRFCKIEVKIPGVGPNSTEWLDLGKFFITGLFEDGDGALIPPITGVEGDFTIPFTFGERNTADSGNMIAVKVTYFGSQITIAKKKVLSLLQLLDP